MTDVPIDQVRAQFPALKTRDDGGLDRIYFDAPGGTQACAPAIARMREHLERGTANSGGAFSSSIETDAMSEAAHAAMADLLGGQPGEIAFGPNMTTLTFSVSRAVSKDWGADNELVLTRLDHDANVAPWLLVARDKGMTVRWIDFDPETGVLDLASLPGLLNPRTRLVAFGGASNALGTLNDIRQMQSSPCRTSSPTSRRSAATFSLARPTNSSALTRVSSGGGANSWSGSMPIRCGPPRSSRRRCASKPALRPSRARRA
jgi:selenocysteine lyase/cysteine desulfurase